MAWAESRERLQRHVDDASDSEWQDVELALTRIAELEQIESLYRGTLKSVAAMGERIEELEAGLREIRDEHMKIGDELTNGQKLNRIEDVIHRLLTPSEPFHRLAKKTVEDSEEILKGLASEGEMHDWEEGYCNKCGERFAGLLDPLMPCRPVQVRTVSKEREE